MQTHGTRWRIAPVAYLPIACAIVAETVFNGIRGYRLGAEVEATTLSLPAWLPEGLAGAHVSLLGAVLVSAAIAVSSMQARAAWLAIAPGTPLRLRLIAGGASALLLAVSGSSVASHLLEIERAKAGAEQAGRTALGLAKADYEAAKADSDRLGAQRSTAEVKTAMEQVKIARWAWEESAECTAERATLRPEVAKACAPFYELRKEMAAAISKADAAERMAKAKAEIGAELARGPVVAAPSPSEAWLARRWGWLMAAALVLLATFGSVLGAELERTPANDNATGGRLPERESPAASKGHLTDADIAQLRALFLASDRPAIAGPSGPSSAQRMIGASGRLPGGESDAPNEDPPKPGASARPSAAVIRLPDAKASALRMVRAELSAGRTFPSQAELCRTFGVPRSTMSDWLGEWEAAGDIPRRRTVGRCKAVG